MTGINLLHISGCVICLHPDRRPVVLTAESLLTVDALQESGRPDAMRVPDHLATAPETQSESSYESLRLIVDDESSAVG